MAHLFCNFHRTSWQVDNFCERVSMKGVDLASSQLDHCRYTPSVRPNYASRWNQLAHWCPLFTTRICQLTSVAIMTENLCYSDRPRCTCFLSACQVLKSGK